MGTNKIFAGTGNGTTELLTESSAVSGTVPSGSILFSATDLEATGDYYNIENTEAYYDNTEVYTTILNLCDNYTAIDNIYHSTDVTNTSTYAYRTSIHVDIGDYTIWVQYPNNSARDNRFTICSFNLNTFETKSLTITSSTVIYDATIYIEDDAVFVIVKNVLSVNSSYSFQFHEYDPITNSIVSYKQIPESGTVGYTEYHTFSKISNGYIIYSQSDIGNYVLGYMPSLFSTTIYRLSTNSSASNYDVGCIYTYNGVNYVIGNIGSNRAYSNIWKLTVSSTSWSLESVLNLIGVFESYTASVPYYNIFEPFKIARLNSINEVFILNLNTLTYEITTMDYSTYYLLENGYRNISDKDLFTGNGYNVSVYNTMNTSSMIRWTRWFTFDITSNIQAYVSPYLMTTSSDKLGLQFYLRNKNDQTGYYKYISTTFYRGDSDANTSLVALNGSGEYAYFDPRRNLMITIDSYKTTADNVNKFHVAIYKLNNSTVASIGAAYIKK